MSVQAYNILFLLFFLFLYYFNYINEWHLNFQFVYVFTEPQIWHGQKKNWIVATIYLLTKYHEVSIMRAWNIN